MVNLTASGLHILVLGLDRTLWQEAGTVEGESLQRLTAYSQYLASYHVVVHALKRANLQGTKLISDKFVAYATNGYTTLDSWFNMIRIGLQIAKRYPLDLIQIQEPIFTGTAGYILSKRLQLPYNVVVYGTNPFDKNWIRESILYWMASPLAKRIIFNSQGIQVDGSQTKHSLMQAGIDQGHISLKPMIPHNIREFMTTSRDATLRWVLTNGEQYDTLVLFVGRVVAQKNLPTLLQLVRKIAPQIPGIRFICIGEGPLRPALQAATQRLGLSDIVLWLGGKPHHEVVRYMTTCDIFILPSRYEGFARVLMEAAAAGKPIIATAVSGSTDGIIDGETGYIVPVDDVEAMYHALMQLATNPSRALAMGRAGRRHAESLILHFSNPRQQINIWEDVLARHRRRSTVV